MKYTDMKTKRTNTMKVSSVIKVSYKQSDMVDVIIDETKKETPHHETDPTEVEIAE